MTRPTPPAEKVCSQATLERLQAEANRLVGLVLGADLPERSLVRGKSIATLAQTEELDTPWERLNSLEKLFFVCCLLGPDSQFKAMTLLFATDYYEKMKGKDKLPDRIRRKLQQSLKTTIGDTPFFFVVEKDSDDGLGFHVHGGFFLPAGVSHRKIVVALKIACLGHEWSDQKFRGRQPFNRYPVDLRPLYGPAGWINYITASRFVIPPSRTYLGNKIKALAREQYNKMLYFCLNQSYN